MIEAKIDDWLRQTEAGPLPDWGFDISCEELAANLRKFADGVENGEYSTTRFMGGHRLSNGEAQCYVLIEFLNHRPRSMSY